MSSGAIFTRLPDSNSRQVFEIDVTKLGNQCHIIFPRHPIKEMLVCTAIEHFTFPPNTQSNKSFEFSPIECGTMELLMCRFPEKFRDVCERAGKTFGLTMSKTRVMVNDHTVLKFPKHPNIILYKRENQVFTQEDMKKNAEKISREMESITKVAMGKSMFELD